MSDLTDVADAVTAQLNNASLGQTFTAERTYSPSYVVDEQPGLKVFVVPSSQALAFATRSEDERSYTVMIGVYNAITDAASIDAMLDFVEGVMDCLNTNGRVTNPDGVLMDIKNEIAFEPSLLNQDNLFVTVVEVTYRLLR